MIRAQRNDSKAYPDIRKIVENTEGGKDIAIRRARKWLRFEHANTVGDAGRGTAYSRENLHQNMCTTY